MKNHKQGSTHIIPWPAFILTLTLAFIITVYAAAPAAYGNPSIQEMEKKVFKLINQAREEKGLQPLTVDSKAYRAAVDHSRDMADRNYFSHTSPENKDVVFRLNKYGFKLMGHTCGENIAANFNMKDPAEAAVAGWLKSPGHYANIMNPKFKYTGVGIAMDKNGKYYFTQVFWGEYR